jgi:hypothetical protein
LRCVEDNVRILTLVHVRVCAGKRLGPFLPVIFVCHDGRATHDVCANEKFAAGEFGKRSSFTIVAVHHRVPGLWRGVDAAAVHGTIGYGV